MDYNTQLKKLILTEYGRNIQNMVDHCVLIKDEKERERCAYALIDIMGSMFPHLRDINDFKHILWDHLAIMSDFKLDIKYPYEVVTKEELADTPEKLEYSRPNMQYRHYGKLLEQIIRVAAQMEEGEQRRQLIRMITAQMKRSYSQWNKEVEDAKILHDLHEISNGKINLDESTYSIQNVKVNNLPNKQRLKSIKVHRKR